MRRTDTAIGAVAARAAVLAAVVGLAAGCSGSSSAGSASPPATTPASTASTGTTSASPASTNSAAASASVAAAAFADIVEPWDPGHPARSQTAPADCGAQLSTMAIEQCYEAKTESADARIDAVQQGRYDAASPSARVAISAQDRSWLAARGPVCQVAFTTGGTIDGINVSACLLDESTARLDAVDGIAAPEAALKSTDNTDPGALSWYTTAEGSRIAMIDTQGDTTGGVIISWVVIGGANGFVVNPAQFTYVDRSFTDPGKVQAPDPSGHRVPAGAEYQFGIDYSHLSADPYHRKSTGGWVYAPGTPVAVWR